ncbi:MAG: apolipoprotein N-acyltransferase [Thermodesulfobacteriota bacterium]
MIDLSQHNKEPIESHRYVAELCAILSGLLLSASFPPGITPWTAWLALVPLLWGISDKPPSRAFVLGLMTGFSHALTLIYWILVVMGHYGGLDIFTSSGILILFCLYLALFPAGFACLSRLGAGSRFQVLWWGVLWVGLEYVRAWILTGFPWCLLGYSQYGRIHLIQVADLTGVYGISFLIALSNGIIYRLLFDRPSFRGAAGTAETVLAILLIPASLVYGWHRVEGYREARGRPSPLRVAVVQGNIDQSLKWNAEFQEKTVQIYESLTRQAAPFRPDLVLWPETAVPFFFQEKTSLSRRVAESAAGLKASLVFGSPAYGHVDGKTRFYNRAYVLSPEGRPKDYYDKTHLVPFGEYVPLKRFLPFVHRLVPAAGDFAAGERPGPLEIPGTPAGVLICYEVIFPELARAQVEKGARVLLNLTNDAWFGRTSAPYQHLSMAVFRAVENARPLVRAANTGISAFINPIGEITLQSGLFSEEVLTQEVGLPGPSLRFYTVHGDLFAAGLLLLGLIKIICALWYNDLLKAFLKIGHGASRSGTSKGR